MTFIIINSILQLGAEQRGLLSENELGTIKEEQAVLNVALDTSRQNK